MDRLPYVRTAHEFVSYERHPAKDFAALVQTFPAFAGFDVGRAAHSSHLSVLVLGGNVGEQDARCIYQVASIWFDAGTRYIDQIERVKYWCDCLRVRAVYYDATRGELEAWREEGRLPGWFPVTFTAQSKAQMAGRLLGMLEQRRLFLLPDERQRRSILQVNNALQAEEFAGEHGDAFWSLAMALLGFRGLHGAAARLIRRSRRSMTW